MNTARGHGHSTDDNPLRENADIACDAFEQVWASGKTARIEDYLGAATGAERSELLKQLLAVEIQFRLQRGEAPTPADYSDRFHSDAAVLADVFESLPQMPTVVVDPSVLSTQANSTNTHVHDWESCLSRCPSFSSMEPSVLAVVEDGMHEERFTAGDLLWRQGDPGDSLLVLQEGEVEISTRDDNGTSHYICRATGPQVLGEMSLLTDDVRTADVRAVTDVQAMSLPAATFHALTKRFPQISVVLTHLIARRLGGFGRDVLAGKTLGGCRIKRRLGRGGMSVVYQAEDVETGQNVALKMMSHRLVYDDDAYARFQREANLIESMSHPNIVRMYRRFAAFHTYFIVMEYCNGETLENIMAARGPLPESDVRKIVGQLASALVYAHDRGVVHRDVKPSNVMLGSDGQVKLMDFGLAVPLDVLSSEGNAVAGTILYMAPEQLLGGDVGPAADYFALGCVAYQLLSGKHLIPPTNAVEIAHRYESWEVPEMSELCPGLSPELCTMLEECLQPDPNRRRPDLRVLC